jgi:hypothetical protein
MEQDVKFDLAKTLIEFNQDQQFIELRERYSTRSFLEIMSVERSENRHSSFLAWLLEAKDFAVNIKDHPIVHLLDIAIRRLGEQDEKINEEVKCDTITGQEGIKNIVLSRDIKDIDIEEVKTEKAVRDVAITEEVKSYKESIQDRIDIYIKCKLRTSVYPNGKEITIIIENKVGSTEGQARNDNKPKAANIDGWKEYCQKKQTERYYTACHSNNTVFLFLTPSEGGNIDKGGNIVEAKDGHFISITYQDILNEIIEPLVANQNLSSRVRVLLEEYVLSLSLPGIYTNDEDNEENKKNTKNKKDEKSIKTAIIMAERKQNIDAINELIGKYNYKKLIISAAKCLVIEDEIDKINDWIEEKTKKETKNKWIGKKNETIRAALEFEPENNKEKDVYKLILSFGKTYKNLLIALLKTHVENNLDDTEESQAIKDVYQSLLGKPKDRSEFTIIYNQERVLDEDSKRMFAEFVIRKYIEYYKSGNNGLNVPYDYFKINETYPLFLSVNDSQPNDSSRYSQETVEFGGKKYYISNQWGITINQEKWKETNSIENLISIDRIFYQIFDTPLFKLENGETYSTNASDKKLKLTLQGPWNEILKDYTIKVKRIYK